MTEVLTFENASESLRQLGISSESRVPPKDWELIGVGWVLETMFLGSFWECPDAHGSPATLQKAALQFPSWVIHLF